MVTYIATRFPAVVIVCTWNEWMQLNKVSNIEPHHTGYHHTGYLGPRWRPLLARWLGHRAYVTSSPVSTWMGDHQERLIRTRVRSSVWTLICDRPSIYSRCRADTDVNQSLRPIWYIPIALPVRYCLCWKQMNEMKQSIKHRAPSLRISHA